MAFRVKAVYSTYLCIPVSTAGLPSVVQILMQLTVELWCLLKGCPLWRASFEGKGRKFSLKMKWLKGVLMLLKSPAREICCRQKKDKTSMLRGCPLKVMFMVYKALRGGCQKWCYLALTKVSGRFGDDVSRESENPLQIPSASQQLLPQHRLPVPESIQT